MLVPKLRFKREDGTDYPEWEEKKLGSVCDSIGDGLHKAPSYDESGDYYFINGNNLKNGKIVIEKQTPKVSVGTLQKSDKSLDTATILMSINGTIGNLAFYQDEKIMLGKSVAYLKVSKNVCKKYIYSVLQTRKVTDNFKLSVTGTTIKNLGLTAIRDTPIFIPCLEEQQKIADFLSTVAEVIAQSEAEVANLQQQKKAAMQKIFSQEVRFKREDGTSYPEWENVKFGSLIKEYRDRTSIENEDVLLSSAISGMFLNTELFGHQRGKSNIGYLKINYGTLILSAQNLHLGNANVNLRFEHGIISPAYKTYHITNCNLYFMAQWIKREKTNQFFYNATTVGASQCRRNVDWNALYKQSILIPHLEEQQKIADFLSAYDEAISYAKQELDKWKELKKGLLQQMFV